MLGIQIWLPYVKGSCWWCNGMEDIFLVCILEDVISCTYTKSNNNLEWVTTLKQY